MQSHAFELGALSAVRFGALNLDKIHAQAFVGPNGTGGRNAYLHEGAAKDFNTAVTGTEATTLPGYSVNGVAIIPASTKTGHLLALQSRAEADFVVNNVGARWLGLTDGDEYADLGASEGGGDNFRLLWTPRTRARPRPPAPTSRPSATSSPWQRPFPPGTDPGVVSTVLLPLGVPGTTSFGSGPAPIPSARLGPTSWCPPTARRAAMWVSTATCLPLLFLGGGGDRPEHPRDDRLRRRRRRPDPAGRRQRRQ